MGYFSINMKDSIESSVSNAIANLKLWQSAGSEDPCDFTYLIGMAITDLEDAQERIKVELQRRAEEKKNETT